MKVNLKKKIINIAFFKFEFTPCMAEQTLQGMELKEKEGKKDYRIQEMFRKNLHLKDVC